MEPGRAAAGLDRNNRACERKRNDQLVAVGDLQLVVFDLYVGAPTHREILRYPRSQLGGRDEGHAGPGDLRLETWNPFVLRLFHRTLGRFEWIERPRNVIHQGQRTPRVRHVRRGGKSAGDCDLFEKQGSCVAAR